MRRSSVGVSRSPKLNGGAGERGMRSSRDPFSQQDQRMIVLTNYPELAAPRLEPARRPSSLLPFMGPLSVLLCIVSLSW